jgi:hypothetical protein
MSGARFTQRSRYCALCTNLLHFGDPSIRLGIHRRHTRTKDAEQLRLIALQFRLQLARQASARRSLRPSPLPRIGVEARVQWRGWAAPLRRCRPVTPV